MKEITLHKLLMDTTTQTHGIGIGISVEPGHVGEPFAWMPNAGQFYGATPEDALQALCEEAHGRNVLLDLDRSAKWREVNGPDGVAGLCDGEAGIVVCRDGKLELVQKITPALEGTTAPRVAAPSHRTWVFANESGLDYLQSLKASCESEHGVLALAIQRLAHKQGLIREIGSVALDWETGEFLVDAAEADPDTLAAAETRPCETSHEEEAGR